MLRRRGFTLIELLVVIAIIGILAAMLFPVFARARESARKTQCLANVKNIAIAVNMYYTDYDKFIPLEHDATVRAWYLDNDIGTCDDGVDCHTNISNPYLKHAVVLDDYIKNRDVWRCPSAKFSQNIAINPGYGTGKWFQYMVDTVGTDCTGMLAASWAPQYPPGWGGTVTDSVAQESCGSGSGTFEQSVAIPWTLNEMSSSTIQDAAKQVAVADSGVMNHQLDRTSTVAYPDTCGIDQVLCNTDCWGDWSNCSQSQSCSPGAIDHGGDGKTAADAQERKNRFGMRHLGGSNVGFADGHAKWFPAETILFGGENWSGYAVKDTQFYGLGCCYVPEKTNRYR